MWQEFVRSDSYLQLKAVRCTHHTTHHTSHTQTNRRVCVPQVVDRWSKLVKEKVGRSVASFNTFIHRHCATCTNQAIGHTHLSLSPSVPLSLSLSLSPSLSQGVLEGLQDIAQEMGLFDENTPRWTDYQVLGVKYDATDAEIKARYGQRSAAQRSRVSCLPASLCESYAPQHNTTQHNTAQHSTALPVCQRRYRQLARLYHPDKSTGEDSAAKMAQVNEAYRRLIARTPDTSECRQAHKHAHTHQHRREGTATHDRWQARLSGCLVCPFVRSTLGWSGQGKEEL